MAECSPRVRVSPAYPHHLELACWEHGLIADLGLAPTAAEIAEHVARHRHPSIRCPKCGWVSYHPEDVRQGYCGHCHWWTSDPLLAPLFHLLHD